MSQSATLRELDPHADSVQSLITSVGERVLALRKARRLSRRELSEMSGVSQRYLAQLEGGQGNISIGLLKCLSLALEYPMEALVVEDDPMAEQITSLVALYRDADPATRAATLDVLDPVRQRLQKAERICLVGLRGAGKSTLGNFLGRDLDMPFVELNDRIEQRAGVPVAEIIALYGQDGYRQLEADCLRDIVESHERLVLAVAGGIVSGLATYRQLLGSFHTVWIKATAEEHMQRVRAQGDLRPMAGNPEAMRQLQDILQSREGLYGEAECHLDTSGKALETSREELRQLLTDHLNTTKGPRR